MKDEISLMFPEISLISNLLVKKYL